MPAPFVPPPYPYDRLDELKALGAALPGGLVDLSIGTPCDPPPVVVLDALARSGAERGYPPSVGSPAYRESAAAWMDRRLGVKIDPAHIAACVGTKELVAGVPQWLRLRRPDLDTVLYPAISYPTYAMGATLAGCRAVPYAHLDDIDPGDAARALCLWVNVPGNPTGALGDLEAAAAWGRQRGVPVLSDECYVTLGWDVEPRSLLHPAVAGPDHAGLLAVHSLSKQSNAAGYRAGLLSGDPELVRRIWEVRRHLGLLVPGPVQAAMAAALADDAHVDAQRERYRVRRELLAAAVRGAGLRIDHSEAGLYLWVSRDEDCWTTIDWLAGLGIVAAPGSFYGPAGSRHVRLALTATDERIAAAVERLGT